MDGVLIDSVRMWSEAFNHTLKHFGARKITKTEFMKHCWGHAPENSLKRYLGKEDIKKVKEFLYENCPNFIDYTKLFPGAKETLEEMKKLNLMLAVFSNTRRYMVIKMLERFEIKSFFSTILGGDGVDNPKPHPEGLHKIFSTFGVAHKDVAFVGDTVSDMKAGKSAGCFTIGIANESTEVLMENGANSVVTSVQDVLGIIRAQ